MIHVSNEASVKVINPTLEENEIFQHSFSIQNMIKTNGILSHVSLELSEDLNMDRREKKDLNFSFYKALKLFETSIFDTLKK